MVTVQKGHILNPSLELFPSHLNEAKWTGNLKQYDFQVLATFLLVSDPSECHLW